MNNPKLTNILLIAIISFNVLFFMGWVMHSGHRHHNRQHFMYGSFYGRGMGFRHHWQHRGMFVDGSHFHHGFRRGHMGHQHDNY